MCTEEITDSTEISMAPEWGWHKKFNKLLYFFNSTNERQVEVKNRLGELLEEKRKSGKWDQYPSTLSDVGLQATGECYSQLLSNKLFLKRAEVTVGLVMVIVMRTRDHWVLSLREPSNITHFQNQGTPQNSEGVNNERRSEVFVEHCFLAMS